MLINPSPSAIFHEITLISEAYRKLLCPCDVPRYRHIGVAKFQTLRAWFSGQNRAYTFTTLEENPKAISSKSPFAVDIADVFQFKRLAKFVSTSNGSDLRLQRFKTLNNSQSRSTSKLPFAPLIPTIARRLDVIKSVTLLAISTTTIGFSNPSIVQFQPISRPDAAPSQATGALSP